METAVRDVFACVASGNAHKLFPLILQEERDNEKLTEAQLRGLLKIFNGGILGSIAGPLIVQGDDAGLSGTIIYKKGGRQLTTLMVYCRKYPDGAIRARGLTYSLVMAAVGAKSNLAGIPSPSKLDRMRATLKGFKILRSELKSVGPQLILGPTGTLSIDAWISGREEQIRRLETKGGDNYQPAIGH